MDGRLGFHGCWTVFQQERISNGLHRHWIFGGFQRKEVDLEAFGFCFSRIGSKLFFWTILVFRILFSGYWMFRLSINFEYKNRTLCNAAQLQIC